MKRRLLQLTAVLSANIFLLCLFSTAMAGTIGNPTARVEEGDFQLGAEIDFTERDVEFDFYCADVEVKSTRYVVRGTYGISDQINVYANWGMADAEIEEIKGDKELSYGAGLKATIHEVDDLKIGVVAQISHFSTEDTVELQDYYYDYSLDCELTWWEYEIAIGASHEGIERFVPYGGILLSKMDGEFEATVTYNGSSGSGEFDFDESDLLGIFLGAHYNVSDQFTVGFEARPMNQNSFSFMANYAF